ncbi:MAG: ketoacyl-ACP synthase III [Lachnospiraceae bacterium]|nr:ketoacyl-ACP synthase III [Lachnospiraceae bacterium]
MKGLRIVSTGRALPKTAVSNEDMSKLVDTNDEWITARTGIKNRYKCQDESCVSLAIKAAGIALERAGIDKNEIGAVITATSTPDYIFPSVSCMIQKELGLSEEIAAFDVSAACTGFLYGLRIAHGFVNSGMSKYILLVGSEQLSRIIDYSDRSTCILFGDGAAAVIVKASDGIFAQKTWTRGDLDALSCDGVNGKECFVHMNGHKVFRFAVTAMEQGIKEVLEKAGLTLSDIDYVVCHQANKRIIEHVKKKYQEHAHKFHVNIDEYGNTSAASIPIVLDEILNEKSDTASAGKQGEVSIAQPRKILCVGFGAGLTWSGAVLEG